MTGLGGLARYDPRWPGAERALARMVQLERDHAGARDSADSQGGFSAIAVNGARQGSSPLAEEDGVAVWLDGEVYATEATCGGFEPGPRTAAVCVLRAFLRRDGRAAALAALDGRYVAVVHDCRAGCVHLVTDRLGDRFLFWTVVGGALAWSTTLGGLLAVPSFVPRVDEQAVREFVQVGHMLGQRTWFAGVQLVPPGSVVSFDLTDGSVTTERYWWWDHIARVEDPPPLVEAADEAARLFTESVEARCVGATRLGVYLSGGLDSRAVAAAAAPRHLTAALSFGVRDCLDVQIAARVCRRLRVPHFIYELTPANWLAPRIPAIWRTGGMVNITHLHGVEALESAAGLFDTYLEGYGGDNFVRGDSLQSRNVLDRFDRRFVLAYTGCPAEWLDDLDEYESLGRSEYVHLENRVRRLWSAAAQTDEALLHPRRPFSANRMIEFVYSLPDRMRYRGRLYRAMLLRTYPDLYRDIPWAATGVPISWVRGSGRVYRYWRAVEKRLTGKSSAVGLDRRGPKDYADYPAWFRVDPARSFFERLVLSPDSLATQYVARDAVRRDWGEVQAGRGSAELVARYLTMEIWLRQVYGGWLPADFDA